MGCLLRGTKREEIERGQVLCKPGSITPHTKFKAEVYILKKEEGGRHTPFFTGYRPQFYFRTTDVTGVAKLPDGVEMVMPGDNVQMEIELIQPIAMDQGLRFAIREGGRTVGCGVVTDLLEVHGAQASGVAVVPAPSRGPGIRSRSERSESVEVCVAGYMASGGLSGLLTVPAGWAVRAEAHEGSFALVWPARATVAELLATLVGGSATADVVLGLRGEPAQELTLDEALATIESAPEEVEFARLDFDRLVLTWSRSRLQLPADQQREAAYEVGLGAEVFDEDFLVRVISGTAVSAISESARALVAHSREVLAGVPAGDLQDSY